MKTTSIRKQIACLLLVPALLLVSNALAGGATSQRDVNPGGGTQANGSDGLRWWLGSNSQLQVNLGNSGQVYSSAGRPQGTNSLFNSVYLRVDRGTNATTRIYHNSDNTSGVTGTLALAQVSQTGISGSGTAASPWQVTTVLQPNSTADGAIRVTILDSYIRPQMWLTRRVTLSGLPTSGASVRFYQNIDTYLLGGDNGPGFTRTSPWNTTGRPDIVGVVKGDQFQALWYEPSSGTPHWDRYFSGYYQYPGRQICRNDITTGTCLTGSGNLSNAIDTNAATDNGIAAQWNVPNGASSLTLEYRLTFAMGAVDLTKEFQPQTINAGGVSTLTFNLNNRTVNAVATINFTDTLPADVRVAPTPNIRTNCPAGGALGGTLPPGLNVAAASGGNTIQIAGASVNGAPSGGERVCQIAVDVTSGVVGQHHNTNANITGTNNLVNLVGDEVLTVVQPQLVASKSVGGTLVAGQAGIAADGHYLIGIANNGSGPTVGTINLVDTLPAGFSAVAVSSAEGTVSCGTLPASGVLTCTFTPTAPIAPAGSATVRINVAIGPAASGSLTNNVAIGGGGDPDPLPNCPIAGNVQCAQVTTPLSRVADLQIVKSNSVGTVTSGGTTTYTLVATNNGPSAANNAIVSENWTSLPGLDCSTATGGGTATCAASGTAGTQCPGTVTPELLQAGVAVPVFPNGGIVTFTLTCRVTATGQP